MKFDQTKALVFSIVAIMSFSIILPSYAEVTDIKTDSYSYKKGDLITFSGTVSPDSNGLVTIVVRDQSDEFVLLTQAQIKADNTFERSTETKKKFETTGVYKAISFIQNMTAAQTTSFGFSVDGSIVIPSGIQVVEESIIEEPVIEETIVETTVQTPTQQETAVESSSESQEPTIADFVDPNQDPQYYLDRYYNEANYKDWFDRNYPDITIEEAVGLTTESTGIVDDTIQSVESIKDEVGSLTQNAVDEIMENEILPEAEAVPEIESPIINEAPSEDNSELGQMALAFGGLAILFAAVYGIKRRVDNNTVQISKNRATIKEKLLGGILSSDPNEVIKNRLAKGEITVEQFNELKKTLKRK